jgi:hypothetical protein
MAKPHPTTKILSHAARRRGDRVAARGASHVLAIGRPFDSDRVIVCVIF